MSYDAWITKDQSEPKTEIKDIHVLPRRGYTCVVVTDCPKQAVKQYDIGPIDKIYFIPVSTCEEHDDIDLVFQAYQSLSENKNG